MCGFNGASDEGLVEQSLARALKGMTGFMGAWKPPVIPELHAGAPPSVSVTEL